MSSDVLNTREEQLAELNRFTERISSEIADITSAIGWTVESITNNDENIILCPYNSSHRVPERSLGRHLVTCQWKAEGYRETDLPLSEPTLPPGAPSSIHFDELLQDEVLRRAKEANPVARIESYVYYTWQRSRYILLRSGERLIPRTSDRLVADFTTDERKALYEYAVANTVKPEIGADIADINNLERRDSGEKEMSLIELLVQERNLKRRRAKHKGIHTNKKSHTEILRELISQQMEVYADYMAAQSEKRADDVDSYGQPTKTDERLNCPQETHGRSSTRRSNSFSSSRNGGYSYETEDCYQERFVEGLHRKSKECKRAHRKPQEYEMYSPEIRSKSTKRKRSERRSRSSSQSRDRKSRKKKSKHRSKEDRHKKKKRKSSRERDGSRRSEHRRKDKRRSKDL